MSGRKPKTFKNIQAGIRIYYCMELKNGNYILYDQNMRNPIDWGSITIIDNRLSTLGDDIVVYYFDYHSSFGWRKNNRKKPKQNQDNKNKDYSGRDLMNEWTALDPTSSEFFYVELQNGKTVLFDEEMGQPIYANQSFKGYDYKSKINILVSRYLPKTANIYYFKQINGDIKFRLAIRGSKSNIGK